MVLRTTTVHYSRTLTTATSAGAITEDYSQSGRGRRWETYSGGLPDTGYADSYNYVSTTADGNSSSSNIVRGFSVFWVWNGTEYVADSEHYGPSDTGGDAGYYGHDWSSYVSTYHAPPSIGTYGVSYASAACCAAPMTAAMTSSPAISSTEQTAPRRPCRVWQLSPLPTRSSPQPLRAAPRSPPTPPPPGAYTFDSLGPPHMPHRREFRRNAVQLRRNRQCGEPHRSGTEHYAVDLRCAGGGSPGRRTNWATAATTRTTRPAT